MATPSNPRTPLFADTQHWVQQQLEQIMRSKIEPWAFFKAGPPMRVTTFFDRQISYQGVKFDGSPQLVFWGRFIEPFLEDLTVRMIDRVAHRAQQRGVEIAQAVLEAGSILRAGTARIYSRMVRIDSVLRADGDPDGISARSVEAEVAGMNRFIDLHVSGGVNQHRAGQGTETGPIDASPPAVFRQIGESHWEIAYQGVAVHVVSGLVGFQMIKLLFESRNEPIGARELRAQSGVHLPLSDDLGLSEQQLKQEGLLRAEEDRRPYRTSRHSGRSMNVCGR